jgi:hypothetical protein
MRRWVTSSNGGWSPLIEEKAGAKTKRVVFCGILHGMAYWRSKILGAEIGLKLVSFFCTMNIDHGFVSYNNSDIRLPLFWNPSLGCLPP